MATASGSPSWRAAVEAARNAPEGIVSFEDAGQSYRLEFHTIAGPGWIVATAVPTTELYAAVERARLNIVLTVGPLILLMVLISAWFGGRLSGTNRRLATVNADLAEATRASVQLAAIVQSADDAIFSIDPAGKIVTWNAAAAEMYQVPSDQALGWPLATLFPLEHQLELPPLLSAVLAGEPIERYETVLQRADGTTFDAWLTFSPMAEGSDLVTGVSIIARDVSDTKRLEKELAHQALHDALTGLPNRVLFLDRLRHSLHRMRAEAPGDRPSRRPVPRPRPLQGHQRQPRPRRRRRAARRAGAPPRDGLRPGDTVARLGGDEFTILLENMSGAEEADEGGGADPRRAARALRPRRPRDRASPPASASPSATPGDATGRTTCCATPTPPCTRPRATGKGRHEMFARAR